MAKTLELLLLLVAAILVVAGTATYWNARFELSDAGVVGTHSEDKSAFNWDMVVFWLVLLACAAAVLLPKVRVWSVLAAGMLIMLAIHRTGNNVSWAVVNYCRLQQADSATSENWNKKCSSGGIVAYFGVLLALLVAFFSDGSMAEAEKGFAGKDKLLSLVSAVFAVVGVVVLWSSVASTASFAGFNLYKITIDTTVTTILATLYVVASTFNGNKVLRAAAGFVSALVFVFIFHDMFTLAKSVGSTNDNQVYAGFLFCWFSMLANMGVVTLQHWKHE